MSNKIIFAIFLLISFAWELNAYSSAGYSTIQDANRNCWPHDIQSRGGHYYCLTFQTTILNKYAEQFGTEASRSFENYDEFKELIKFVENNGFCASRVTYHTQRLYPDYAKYLAVGKKIRDFAYTYGYCAPKKRPVQNKKN
ncbi:uncharacterized protein LOC122502268 [Leptopilina heterotoma]|uniref:uncharacterized protein LOC122502268 n=1 Tax=Leptopilina heterotoma TaxID=63436 RepID=UPI001CA866EF|nr:uncharacterized protein LOC122502268 [Leptopilina heterotoma]